MALTEQELIEEKLKLTQMQIEATADADALIDTVKQTLDQEMVLYSVQMNALNKIQDILWNQKSEIERLTSKNSSLKANNAVLSGMAVEEQPDLTPEQLEYDKIMNDGE